MRLSFSYVEVRVITGGLTLYGIEFNWTHHSYAHGSDPERRLNEIYHTISDEWLQRRDGAKAELITNKDVTDKPYELELSKDDLNIMLTAFSEVLAEYRAMYGDDPNTDMPMIANEFTDPASLSAIVAKLQRIFENSG